MATDKMPTCSDDNRRSSWKCKATTVSRLGQFCAQGNRKMWEPNVSVWCDNGFHSRLKLSRFQADIIAIINSSMIPITVSVNILLFLSLVKTRQLRSISSMFMCALCVVDAGMGAVVQVIVSLLFTVLRKSQVCKLEVAGTFLTFFFGHFSGFLVVSISVDRAIHMKYLYKYNSIMTHSRAKIIIVLCFVLAVTFGTAYVLSCLYQIYSYVNAAILIADALAVSIVFFTYMRIFFRVKEHVQESAVIRSGSPGVQRFHDLTKASPKPKYALAMAKTIFCILGAIFIAYIPYVMISLSRAYVAAIIEVEPSRHLEFAMYFTYLLVYLNSSMNAVIFLFGNAKCKCWVLQPLVKYGILANIKQSAPTTPENTTSGL